MTSSTRWTWVWVNSVSWWWTGRLVCCDSWGHRVRHNWTELNWWKNKFVLIPVIKIIAVVVSTKSCPSVLWPNGLYPARLLCPWDFPVKNTGVGCHFLLQGIFRSRYWMWVSWIGRLIFYHWATKEALQLIIVMKSDWTEIKPQIVWIQKPTVTHWISLCVL